MNKLSLLELLGLVIRRDLLLAMRRRTDVLTTLIFFVMVVSLFPLGPCVLLVHVSSPST